MVGGAGVMVLPASELEERQWIGSAGVQVALQPALPGPFDLFPYRSFEEFQQTRADLSLCV
jgi:hypothetical protein